MWPEGTPRNNSGLTLSYDPNRAKNTKNEEEKRREGGSGKIYLMTGNSVGLREETFVGQFPPVALRKKRDGGGSKRGRDKFKTRKDGLSQAQEVSPGLTERGALQVRETMTLETGKSNTVWGRVKGSKW